MDFTTQEYFIYTVLEYSSTVVQPTYSVSFDFTQLRFYADAAAGAPWLDLRLRAGGGRCRCCPIAGGEVGS